MLTSSKRGNFESETGIDRFERTTISVKCKNTIIFIMHAALNFIAFT